MVEKRKKPNLNAKYRKPLPFPLSVDKYGQLPQVIVHSPLSWLYLWYRMACIYVRLVPKDTKIPVSVTKQENGEAVFAVRDPGDMDKLWSQGFFGKGTLSRSDPSWSLRTKRRLDLDQGELSMEEVTNIRRDERKRYKHLRSLHQKFEIKQRTGSLNDDDVGEWQSIQEALERAKNGLPIGDVLPLESAEGTQEALLRKEDKDLITPDGEVQQLEFLQLQKTETFFLQWALQAIDVSDQGVILTTDQLLRYCSGEEQLKSTDAFLNEYVVYHHFRSLGWCVRSGIKFGCDMILYKRGPPFQHAEYAVLVVPDKKTCWKQWEDLMAVARVIGGVRKTLVIVFVEGPNQELFNQVLERNEDEREKFTMLLKLYKVNELVYRRWSPARTRE